MIIREHCVIRGAGVDDALWFHAYYLKPEPVSSLLDQRHELWTPTLDEMFELFGPAREELTKQLNAVEDREGRVRGFASVRTNPRDPFSGNFIVLFHDEQDYRTEMAREVGDYLMEAAFEKRSLRKVMTQCLDHEREFREFILGRGFSSDGVQREVVYAGGRWRNIESFTRVNPRSADRGLALAAPAAAPHA